MRKRILSLALAMLMIASFAVSAAAKFSDIDQAHWGYSAVSKLVSDGTVNGYPDGSFKPNGLVKRSEFVKMMGEGSVMREKDFSDLPSDHWAYKYAMTSEFDVSNNKFEPEKPITREETIVLLYKRAGSPEEITAPSAITVQAKNKAAVSWAYNNGIMIGDDGVNLRLDGNLSRVEAAALIIRARETDFSKPNQNITDVADAKLLKRIYESFAVTESYNEKGTLTIGELSNAALRIISEDYNIRYSAYPYKADFDHKYAKDVAIMNELCFGEDKVNASFADKKATKEEAVAALTVAFIKKSSKSVSYGDMSRTFKDAGEVSAKKKSALSFAYNNGILLNGEGKLNGSDNATQKDIAALLLMLDSVRGVQTVVSTKKDGDSYAKYTVKLNHNLAQYPSNHEKFQYISEGVSKKVYEKAIDGNNPKKAFVFACDYAELIVDHFTLITNGVKGAYGVDMELILYPELVYDTAKGELIVRALCRINDVPSNPVLVGTVFAPEDLAEDVDGFLKKGMEFFVEIKTSYLNLIK